MKPLRATCSALLVCSLAAGLFLGLGRAADPAPPTSPPAPLVVHEWGTFTSFSGSDGVPLHFSPDNSDLPEFVYYQAGRGSKDGRLHRDGTISMETPVVYFYADHETNISLKVDFPRGWITEWYPFAAASPSPADKNTPGQSMRWNVRLLPGKTAGFPGDCKGKEHYYRARETDAVPVQAEVTERNGHHDPRGRAVVQREKFLFYRGVGTFAPPVSLKVAGGEVRVSNTSGGKVDGLVLVHVRGGQVGFKAIPALDPGGRAAAAIPAADGTADAVAGLVVKHLTAAGLYPKEARAMVNTWKHAWFGEDGTRLLYHMPAARVEEILPLTVTPKPAEVARAFMGRYDFITPEQEAEIDRQVGIMRAASEGRASRAEGEAAVAAVRKVGRFWWPAREQAEQRLNTAASRR